MLSGLDHINIETTDLGPSLRFYEEVLGLKPGWRPAFGVPGAWLYTAEEGDDATVTHQTPPPPTLPRPKNARPGQSAPPRQSTQPGPTDPSAAQPIIHLVQRDSIHSGPTGAIHHVALKATGLEQTQAHFNELGIPHEVRQVPDLQVTQIFLDDPNGVKLELNFYAEALAPAAIRHEGNTSAEPQLQSA